MTLKHIVIVGFKKKKKNERQVCSSYTDYREILM